MIKNQRKM